MSLLRPIESARGWVIGAAGSGSGKTTVALAMMAALRRRGLTVAPFKVGPDFIDPGHHQRACGRISRNLDGWMMDREANRRCFARHAAGADIAVVEGVMGLFDGYDGRSEAGSTAQMAKWLGLPVILVVDARSMARSAAALVQGFENFDPDVSFAGVIFNRIGSPRHLKYLKEAIADHVRMPCLGGWVRDESVAMPERHLGLVTDADRPLEDSALDRLADLLEEGCDLDGLLAGRKPTSPEISPAGKTAGVAGPVRIGVARDRAFCFYYPENIELLEDQGAQIVYFSPLSDSVLPAGLDGLYFGGGYPELHAASLAANRTLAAQVLDASRRKMPIYGECGGFMYLCRELVGTDGRSYPMAGCFPFRVRMEAKLRALGYREVVQTRDTLLGPVGTRLRGHEFHYSELADGEQSALTAYRVKAGTAEAIREEGYLSERTLGSYLHLHFGSRPEAAAAFVASAAAYRKERLGP